MSAEPLSQLVDRNGIRDTLAEICASHDEFDRFFSEVFDQLEILSGQLIRRQQGWLSERREVEENFQRRAARLDGERAELAAAQEVAHREAEETRAQIATASAESGQQVQQMLEEAERERAALHSALEAAQAQASQMAEVARELAATRTELAEARQEIQRQREELEALGAGARPQADEGLRQQIQKMEKEQAAMERDRLALETELEAVRVRAAEMTEAMAEQQRQAAAERAQWADEIRRMRRLVESFAKRQVEPGGTAAEPPAPPAPGRPPQGPREARQAPAGGDPVLDSVMAQFEMLQKDVARRRKSVASPQEAASR